MPALQQFYFLKRDTCCRASGPLRRTKMPVLLPRARKVNRPYRTSAPQQPEATAVSIASLRAK
ncbi:hypothetical protein [Xanthomonas oryzae]|uniref:hypothetical protein n=1 Tax=Xanthomonas oryzae TaxID=347 RepID=UPI000A83A29C|nr:hypothetical protein [Xanthomonas oryzae]MEC5078135.1 hypothetical protein [Xanthomonas oryzae pv. oryzicola]